NGGTNGIDTVLSGDTFTLNLDTTEIASTTFGSGSPFTWTFDAGTVDPTIAFGSNSLNLTAATVTVTGNLTVSGLSGTDGYVTATAGLLGSTATIPWSDISSQPNVVSSIDGVINDEGNIDLIAGTDIS